MPAGQKVEASQKPQHVFLNATVKFVEEEVDGGRPLRTSSTSKEVGVEQQHHRIVYNDVNPFFKNIRSFAGWSQDFAVGYDDRSFKKSCFIKEIIVLPDFGRRPEAEFEVFPIKIRLKSSPKMPSYRSGHHN